MDPITQGLLGAAAAQATVTKWLGRRTWFYGALGGMAADLDIFIRSSEDPLVAWTYHRHFTHSLAFIPIGGLICALPWLLSPRHRPRAKPIVAATTVGYATHALLDAFTSYGTMLWWPFSRARVAWDSVSVIDPIVTLALAVAVVFAARRVASRPAVWGLVAAGLYLGLCGVQRSRVLEEMTALAKARGHAVERLRVMPSPLSNVVWRSIYDTGDTLVIDLVRAPWFGSLQVYEGSQTPHLTVQTLPLEIGGDPRLRAAFETFSWFADGWTAAQPSDDVALIVGDLRYGTTVEEPVAMWGVAFDPEHSPPVRGWSGPRDMEHVASRAWDILWGNIAPSRLRNDDS